MRGADRDDCLSETGSGSNWLANHLAMLLALHEFDFAQPHGPWPGFLAVDQPNQAYFPKDLYRDPMKKIRTRPYATRISPRFAKSSRFWARCR